MEFRETETPFNATGSSETKWTEFEKSSRTRAEKLSHANWYCPYECLPRSESATCTEGKTIACGHGCEEGEVCCVPKESFHVVALAVAGPVVLLVVAGLLALSFK